MSVLAHSELLKLITGIEENKLEEPFKILSRTNTTSIRLNLIRKLAKYEPISLGQLLHLSGMSRGGGSYLTIRKYFCLLEKEGLLKSKSENKKTIWKFSEQGELLKKYILS